MARGLCLRPAERLADSTPNSVAAAAICASSLDAFGEERGNRNHTRSGSTGRQRHGQQQERRDFVEDFRPAALGDLFAGCNPLEVDGQAVGGRAQRLPVPHSTHGERLAERPLQGSQHLIAPRCGNAGRHPSRARGRSSIGRAAGRYGLLVERGRHGGMLHVENRVIPEGPDNSGRTGIIHGPKFSRENVRQLRGAVESRCRRQLTRAATDKCSAIVRCVIRLCTVQDSAN